MAGDSHIYQPIFLSPGDFSPDFLAIITLITPLSVLPFLSFEPSAVSPSLLSARPSPLRRAPHSPPANNTRSQRNPAVLTPTARVPLDCTPSVHQLSANVDRGPPTEGETPSRKGGMKSRRSRYFSALWVGYPGTSEGARAILGEVEDEGGKEVPQGSNLAPTNHPPVSQSDPSLVKITDKMATIMGQPSQAEAPRDNSKAPAFNPPSIKAPDNFDGTQAHKLAGKLIEPYLSNISNEDPSYLLNNWQLFEMELLTLFGDPNEVRKAKQELDNLRMKESGHVSLYIADFRSLLSRIGDWGERAYIHVYRRGLASRPLDQLASYPGNSDSLQELMDITLELDTRYHERQKEKGSIQEKKLLVTGSNYFSPPQDSPSKRPHHNKNNKGKQFQVSKDKPHYALLNKENKLEQWDEEEGPEGIETVLKVVPPAYRQYLDVFSKLKAEKLAPHHTCDHHIKLEGLLPPVGVIYSLSNQESETLQAYISENV
ncbi:hypothetical protein O181_003357 [Austropuccinia psidii MF-1]|uniref:Retrotransposon gag domain-containing protein n=1 Tax=Austropuccinia psidii MF-1 TaxID=1389203 RepID=A0A9Q3BE88_9BASI|nr:hypothetical protein [Austropuccinia psidii MF-1]